jgi:LuxR family transcriptional regulator, maltose regulon positive regulatory protein
LSQTLDPSHEPLLKTKLFIPQLRSGLVSRPRLLAKLAEGADKVLTLICAPAGYGKTTLLVEWISEYQEDHDSISSDFCWLSLDEEDNDPNRFLSYLITAFKCGNVKLSDETTSLFSSFPPPPPRSILTFLINDLAATTDPVILILDDYQFISNPIIHNEISFLLERMPESGHVVIATRSDPPISLVKLRARNQLIEIRADQLCFSSGEVVTFLHKTMQLPLSLEEISTLETRTEGWPAGLQMAALSMQGRSDTDQFINAFSGNHRYILDYLAEEVFNRQQETVQQFLLNTSILSRLSGELCDALTESQSHVSQSILEYLDRANLFVVSLDDKRGWFRYHQLFADLLHARLNQSQPDLVPSLHRRASDWYEQNGFINEAVQHASSAHNNERVAELIERYAPVRWSESDTSIAQMAGSLPADMLITRPKLGIYQAWLLIGQGQIEKAVPLLNGLSQHFASESPASQYQWVQSMVALVQAFIFSSTSNPETTPLPDYQTLEKIPEEDLILRNAADNIYGMLLARRGDLDHAAQVLTQCIRRENKPDGILAIPTAIPFLVRIRIMQGQLHEAEALCQDILKPIEKKGVRLIYTAGSLKIALGQVLYEWNRLDEAEQYVRDGIRDNEPWDSISADVVGYLTLAIVLQARNDHDRAMEIAEKLEKRLEGHTRPPELADEINTLRIRLLLANGDIQSASAWGDQIQLPEPIDYHQEHLRLTLARIRLAQGKYAEALHLLDGMATIAAASQRTTRQLKFELLLAIAHFGENHILEALQLLDTCLAQAEPEGYTRLFLDAGEPARKLLSRYLQMPTQTHQAYAQRLIDAFISPARVLSPAISINTKMVESLTARELEVLHLLAEGYSNHQVAEKLILAEGTVKYYVHAILEKLQVHSRTQAIAKARELTLI